MENTATMLRHHAREWAQVAAKFELATADISILQEALSRGGALESALWRWDIPAGDSQIAFISTTYAGLAVVEEKVMHAQLELMVVLTPASGESDKGLTLSLDEAEAVLSDLRDCLQSPDAGSSLWNVQKLTDYASGLNGEDLPPEWRQPRLPWGEVKNTSWWRFTHANTLVDLYVGSRTPCSLEEKDGDTIQSLH